MTHRRPSRLPLRTHPCSSQKECHCLLSPQDGQWETSDTKLYMPLLLETSAQLLRSFPLDSAQKAFISQVIKEERVLWRIGLPRNQVHKVKKFFPPVSNGATVDQVPWKGGFPEISHFPVSASATCQDAASTLAKRWNAVTWLLRCSSFVKRKSAKLLLWANLHRNYWRYSANK